MAAVHEKYIATINTSGTLHCGLSLKWDNSINYFNISIPRYADNALQDYANKPFNRPQHSPLPWKKTNYGAKQQMTEEPNHSPALSPTCKTRIQQIIVTLLYYEREVDSSILPCLGNLGTVQANPTEKTESIIHRLLSYLHTHPDTTVRYKASRMVVYIHSDAS